MPLERKPLFRPDLVRSRMAGFDLGGISSEARASLILWAEWLADPRGRSASEVSLLAEFLRDIFVGLLGYRDRVGSEARYSFSRERHVEVDGRTADAVLGCFGDIQPRFVVAVEGKARGKPLDHPYGGRRLSAVDQAYRYAINLRCDWIVVTNFDEIRLYHKGSNQRTFESFDTRAMAFDERQLRRFAFLLGAERVVGRDGRCHLDDLRNASERADADLTQAFYAEYSRLRRRLLQGLAEANPSREPRDLLTVTQRLLDRVLFIAFCEDRGLLPPESLKHAYEHADPYNPRPVWGNFKGLFRALHEGSRDLDIPAYDGGLFAPSADLEDLSVPDELCAVFKALGDYDFRSPDQVAVLDDEGQGPPVDVEILGHLFEQSITDLEELATALEGGEAVPQVLSKRHREGAFYTPAFVTRFIVEETVDRVVAERYSRLLERHRTSAAGTASRVLDDPAAYELDALNEPQRRALVAFWTAWIDELATIRVLDPACGSGAFLIEAFDFLYAQYRAAILRLDELRGLMGLYDPDRSILQENLFGVDLNPEAVEIARLSIWIKTAQRGKALTELDASIRPGNSIVADPALDPRALDWEETFPKVVGEGGFDVVLGNPPYVRQELLGQLKPHLKAHYSAYHGMADLYVYFFERGLRLLRPGGWLSFIVTNKWLKAGYAEPLRRLLADEAWVSTVVDLGHAKQIFPDADVSPSIILVRRPHRGSPPAEARATVISRDDVRTGDLTGQIREASFAIRRCDLGAEPWSLEPPDVAKLMAKIRDRGAPLAEHLGAKPLYGVKTGCNEAFLVDQATRDRLVADDAGSADLLKPYLRGQDIDRWHPSYKNQWMIFTRRGVNIDRYPAVLRYLEGFRERLEPRPVHVDAKGWRGRKPGNYKWFEIQDAVDYWRELEGAKIIYQVIQFFPAYAKDNSGFLGNDKTFSISTGSAWLLGVLNSSVIWWFNWRYLAHLKDEALSPQGFKMEKLPIATGPEATRAEAERAVEILVAATRERQERSRLLADWLQTELELDKLSRALSDPCSLDREAWVAEIRKARGRRRPLSAAALRAVHEEYDASIAPIRAGQPEVDRLERRLATLVNQAYDLTTEEVELMWRTAPPRMPPGRPDGESSFD